MKKHQSNSKPKRSFQSYNVRPKKQQRSCANKKRRSQNSAPNSTSKISTAAVAEAVKESGIKFYLANKDIKKLIASEPGFDVKSDGSAFIEGRSVPLAVALKVFASRHAHLTERTKADIEAAKFREETKIKSKADFKNNREKIAFIREHGGAAFDALPLRPPVTDPEKMSTKDLMRLPVREKVRLVNIYGEAGWSALLERNKTL